MKECRVTVLVNVNVDKSVYALGTVAGCKF